MGDSRRVAGGKIGVTWGVSQGVSLAISVGVVGGREKPGGAVTRGR